MAGCHGPSAMSRLAYSVTASMIFSACRRVLAAATLVGALANQRGENCRIHPVLWPVGETQQRVVLADPLTAPAAPHHVESGRCVTGAEQQGEVTSLPATVQKGACYRLEQLARVGDALVPASATALLAASSCAS
jgi:hypothetical protein